MYIAKNTRAIEALDFLVPSFAVFEKKFSKRPTADTKNTLPATILKFEIVICQALEKTLDTFRSVSMGSLSFDAFFDLLFGVVLFIY
jgi:hypothetical protein